MAINHTIKAEELKDIYDATIAIEKEQGHTPEQAKLQAQALSYGVFRDLLTQDSVIRYIVDKARRVFTHDAKKD
jgi:hypothetical protein